MLNENENAGGGFSKDPALGSSPQRCFPLLVDPDRTGTKNLRLLRYGMFRDEVRPATGVAEFGAGVSEALGQPTGTGGVPELSKWGPCHRHCVVCDTKSGEYHENVDGFLSSLAEISLLGTYTYIGIVPNG